MKFRLVVDDTPVDVEADEKTVRVDGRALQPSIRKVSGGYVVTVGRHRFVVRPESGGAIVNGVRRQISVAEVAEAAGAEAASPERRLREVRPPMPGRVVRVLVRPGDAVARGQPLLVLEAMKMQNEIAAPAAGVVEAIRVGEGDSVTAQDVLAILRGR